MDIINEYSMDNDESFLDYFDVFVTPVNNGPLEESEIRDDVEGGFLDFFEVIAEPVNGYYNGMLNVTNYYQYWYVVFMELWEGGRNCAAAAA